MVKVIAISVTAHVLAIFVYRLQALTQTVQCLKMRMGTGCTRSSKTISRTFLHCTCKKGTKAFSGSKDREEARRFVRRFEHYCSTIKANPAAWAMAFTDGVPFAGH